MVQPTYLDLAGLTTYDGLIKAEISGKIDVGGKAGQIPFGRVDSTSTSTAFTATVDGVTELVDGTCVMLHNGVVTSASGFTVNVNSLGAKPVYNNLATGNEETPTNPTRDTTIFNINYTMLFVYDSQLVSGGAWICYRGYDANTNTIGYQLRTNSGNRVMADTAYRYRLYFTSADGSKWVPANTSTSTDATTSRTLNTRAIDPFGPIVYNSTNGTTNSGARPGVATLWQQYTLTIGYSYVKSLTAWDSVWLKCQPNADGSAVMKDIVQALPTSKDGYIYILLGMAYSATAMELRAEHPVYWHDGTGIRLWTGAEPSSGSVTVDSALSSTSENPVQNKAINIALQAKQDELVSGTNIKTVNGNSLLGSGDLTISGGGGGSSEALTTEEIIAAVDAAFTKLVESIDITVTPVWSGSGTDSIKVDLYANGTTLRRTVYMVASAITFSDVNKYDSHGHEIAYSIQATSNSPQATVDGVTGNATDGFVVNCTYTSGGGGDN